MTTPAPIGPLHYDLPRAIFIRDPEDVNTKHSAVHSSINVVTDSMKQTNALLEAWPELMQQLAEQIETVLNALPVENGG